MRARLFLLAALAASAPARAADVLVAPLPAGTLLAESDFADDAAIADPRALTARTAAGMELRRAMAAGQSVRATDVRPPRAVLRGQTVTLEMTGPGYVITTAARALADGEVGAMIRVQAVATGRTLEARVMRDGLVRISG